MKKIFLSSTLAITAFMPFVVKSDQFSFDNNAYYMELSLSNTNKQEFNISITTLPKEEGEMEYTITLTDGKKKVPDEIKGHVFMIRNNKDIMNFDCQPNKVKDKTIFRFSIKTNYIEESIGQIYYTTKKEDGTPGHSVIYRFRLNDFIKRVNPLLKNNPDE